MAETVTLLEHRIRQVVDRLRSLEDERQRLTRELERLHLAEQERRDLVANAADSMDQLARDLSEERA